MGEPLKLPLPALGRWRQSLPEKVGEYRVFQVCRVELEDANGMPRGDAFTFRCNDWCNVIAITPDDDIVLVWQYRFGKDAFSLEIPGGVIEAGESPLNAARRELREETGYEAEHIELLQVVDPNPALQSNRCYTFVAHRARRTSPTAFDPQEELATVRAPIARLADLLDGGQITHSLVTGALEAYCRKRSPPVAPPRAAPNLPEGWSEAERLVCEIESSQRRKVLDLARRLRPGLTHEDIGNPHDFPELGDPDWQYEDGMLAGVQSVLVAVRARKREMAE